MKIELLKFNEGAKAPKYGRDLDAGADIFLPQNFVLKPGMNKVPLGVGIKLPAGTEGQVRPRSGTLLRGIAIHNPPIDPGYTGEIHALAENKTDDAIQLFKGERICQLVIVAGIVRADFVDKVKSDRGDKGFNSSGR